MGDYSASTKVERLLGIEPMPCNPKASISKQKRHKGMRTIPAVSFKFYTIILTVAVLYHENIDLSSINVDEFQTSFDYDNKTMRKQWSPVFANIHDVLDTLSFMLPSTIGSAEKINCGRDGK